MDDTTQPQELRAGAESRDDRDIRPSFAVPGSLWWTIRLITNGNRDGLPYDLFRGALTCPMPMNGERVTNTYGDKITYLVVPGFWSMSTLKLMQVRLRELRFVKTAG